MNWNVRECEGAVVFDVKVVAGSSRTAVAGLLDGALKIRVSVPAQKGKANRCLINFLAKKLNVKTSALSILSGQTTPLKRLRVIGLSPDDLLKALKLR